MQAEKSLVSRLRNPKFAATGQGSVKGTLARQLSGNIVSQEVELHWDTIISDIYCLIEGFCGDIVKP